MADRDRLPEHVMFVVYNIKLIHRFTHRNGQVSMCNELIGIPHFTQHAATDRDLRHYITDLG